MFEIKSISGKDVTVEATLKSGKVTQTINGVPVHDKEATREFLTNYFKAYERGKEMEANHVEEVTVAPGLVGKKLEPVVEEAKSESVV